jgi:hypothetical protein
MTTGNFSQTPSDVLANALAKNYMSVHVEQGVPVLDRDLNLLGDLIIATMQQVLSRHIGDGTAGATDFAIQSNGNPLDFTILAGTYLAGGMTLTLAANTTYLTQHAPASASPAPPLPALTAPPPVLPVPRTDTVYLDIWRDEIDDASDHDLANATDVGLRTSTRSKAQFVVRVAENASTPPASPAQHLFVPLAQLTRPTPTTVTINDLRLAHLSIAQVTQRLATIQSALKPVITSVAPNHVLPGQANPIIVSGRNLDLGGAIVMLGPTPGVVDPATTSSTLSVAVPASATPGAWPLTVQTTIGTATAPVQLTIDTPPPPPAFVAQGGGTAQIVPSHGPALAPPAQPTQLTLNGSHFTGVNRVTFNVVPAVSAVLGGDLVSVTDTVIKVNVPASLAGAVGSTMTLTVGIDGIPSMHVTSDAVFTVDPLPILTPTFGPTGSQITTTPATNPVTQSHGGQVTLHGTNFGTSTATTQVRFIGANIVMATAGDFVSITPTAITVKVPAALTVAAAPGNNCRISVIMQNVESLPSDDRLLVT